MKRIKLFALNRRVRKVYLTTNPACCQRFSNNSEPKFTDVQAATIYLYGKNLGLRTKQTVYNFAKQKVSGKLSGTLRRIGGSGKITSAKKEKELMKLIEKRVEAERKKRTEAARAVEMLITTLANGEKMYWSVLNEARAQGIKTREIHKARQLIGIKKRTVEGICYVSMDAVKREEAEEILRVLRTITEREAISSDWIKVEWEEGEAR